jgi:hypothetical protein
MHGRRILRSFVALRRLRMTDFFTASPALGFYGAGVLLVSGLSFAVVTQRTILL